jgi:hypothetical protein
MTEGRQYEEKKEGETYEGWENYLRKERKKEGRKEGRKEGKTI